MHNMNRGNRNRNKRSSNTRKTYFTRRICHGANIIQDNGCIMTNRILKELFRKYSEPITGWFLYELEGVDPMCPSAGNYIISVPELEPVPKYDDIEKLVELVEKELNSFLEICNKNSTLYCADIFNTLISRLFFVIADVIDNNKINLYPTTYLNLIGDLFIKYIGTDINRLLSVISTIHYNRILMYNKYNRNIYGVYHLMCKYTVSIINSSDNKHNITTDYLRLVKEFINHHAVNYSSEDIHSVVEIIKLGEKWLDVGEKLKLKERFYNSFSYMDNNLVELLESWI